MNKYIVSILCALGVSLAVQADNNIGKVEMKCHVELLGGKQTLVFTHLSQAKKQNIKSFIQAQKNVYKVVECVELNEKFSTVASNRLDELTVR